MNKPDLAHLHSSRAANHKTLVAQLTSTQEREKGEKKHKTISRVKCNHQFAYSPRTTREADKVCWWKVAVGCDWRCGTRFCLDARNYHHGSGPEGVRVNGRRRQKCQQQKRRLRDDESGTKEMDANLEARGENKPRRLREKQEAGGGERQGEMALMPSLLPHFTARDDR